MAAQSGHHGLSRSGFGQFLFRNTGTVSRLAEIGPCPSGAEPWCARSPAIRFGANVGRYGITAHVCTCSVSTLFQIGLAKVTMPTAVYHRYRRLKAVSERRWRAKENL